MLIQNGQVQKGIAIIEDVVQELVLGQHRPMERRSRSEMASIMWVSVALWRCWAYPTEVHNTEVMVRRMVQRLLTVKGPMHPLASLAHLMFAFLLRTKPHGGSLNMTTKSIQHMQKTLYARSPLLQYAYRVGCVLNTLSHRWKHAIDHANAALQVATANGCYDETLTIHEQDLMGCLLLTPNTVTVTILREELSQQLEGRIASLAKGYGANHARLVTPLLNWSEFLYLQGKYEAAFEHAQRAVRIADPKGLLYVTGKILLPGTLLPKSSLQQRNHLVLSVLQTPHQVFQLVQVLYFNAAIQVALGKTSDALDG
ncbi:hypothetical protein, conserved [Angomonas deanei]|uniref:Tetratricopeptide repeat n=1 Tax=Angomonas deanei TaxID=59799 RepID=A0A7G2CEH0_9TRYP|nr:hypothetical protein, conserved [Angomonas deanei]